MSMKHLLQRPHVPFEVVAHPRVFDAQHLAYALHTTWWEIAKTVLLRIDHGERYVVAVLPSTLVALKKLSGQLGGATVRLATALDIAERCPDCEFGVLPPIGSHYRAEKIVDTALTGDEHISFESDSFSEAIRMKCSGFQSSERLVFIEFGCRTKQPAERIGRFDEGGHR
jgi:Ala-tRNA(Pro) deacylase